MSEVVFRVTFERWCATVSLYLEIYAGRALADLPISAYPLRTWYSRGVRALVVAQALTTLCPPRSTLVRFYTDDRPLQTLHALKAKGTQYAVHR